MDPPNPTTPDRRFPQTKLNYTPNRFAPTFAPSSQPVGSTQCALQASLTGNVVFANEAIVDAVFQPSQVADQTVEDIIAEIDGVPRLASAYKKVLSGKLAEKKKYRPLITLLDHITTYEYQEAPLANDDYARHVRRAWVDTHSQCVRTDPGIYLPGEVIAEDEDGEDDGNSDQDHDSENDSEKVDEPIQVGKKRKLASRSKHAFLTKFAKTAQPAPALNVIDDRRPDLTLIDCPVGETVPIHPYGRHGCLFIEVKVKPNKKPNPQEVKPGKGRVASLKSPAAPTIVKSILRQVADIARLHLATRPFMRYSLHLTLCGTIFNICLFDRAGGVVSKDYNLKNANGFETFIRIIRRATCDMDAYALGLDPTVIPLDYLGSVARYPRFKVEVGENTYFTDDCPIWQSTTLQGRGTWVFGVTTDNNPNPKPKERLVLKNAWRAPGRLPESTLYGVINSLQADDKMLTLRCVAEFVDGGDVTIEEEIQQGGPADSSKGKERIVTQRVAVRVSGHRKFVEDADLKPHNPTLHRVVLATRGRSMVLYTSLVELLGAAECAAEGLMALYQRGVDHRDVSIGNVLLGTDPEKAVGFISDLDLSSISDVAIKAAYPNDYDQIISQLKDGEWRTGTALFMAGDLLDALSDPDKSHFAFQHGLCHDFESLIWVIVYAMMIHHRNNLAATDPKRELYKKTLDDCWAVHSYSNLHRCHNHMISVGCSVKVQRSVSLWFPDAGEAAFFRDAMLLLRSQTQDGVPIPYESLGALFKKHIQLAKESHDPVASN